MKRLAVSLTVAAVAATALGAGVASAAGASNLAVTSGGVKKAEVTWDVTGDPSASFDAYLVTADDDTGAAPLEADRTRFVDDEAERVVVFDDLTAGKSYEFQLFAVDFTDVGIDVVPADGQPAGTPLDVVLAEGATLTLNTNTLTVLTGNAVTVSGTLTGQAGTNPTSVNLYSAPYPYNNGDWTSVPVATDANGKWSTTKPLTINTRFYALYEPTSGDEIGAWSRFVTVEVRKKISMKVSPGTTINRGTKLKFTGKLRGVDPANLGGVVVSLQRYKGGSWGRIKRANLDTSTGSYQVTFEPGANADGKYRIFSGMGPAYADSWSKAVRITIN